MITDTHNIIQWSQASRLVPSELLISMFQGPSQIPQCWVIGKRISFIGEKGNFTAAL